MFRLGNNFFLYSKVELRKFGEEAGASEIHARSEALKNNLTFISPYNDVDIVHGQATVAVEIFQQNPNIEYIFVSVGGGGLISGKSPSKRINPI